RVGEVYDRRRAGARSRTDPVSRVPVPAGPVAGPAPGARAPRPLGRGAANTSGGPSVVVAAGRTIGRRTGGLAAAGPGQQPGRRPAPRPGGQARHRTGTVAGTTT